MTSPASLPSAARRALSPTSPPQLAPTLVAALVLALVLALVAGGEARAQVLHATSSGPQSGAAHGAALAPVGDVDGDGLDEVLVGSPGEVGLAHPGSARLLSGADGSVLRVLSGTTPGARFGAACAGPGDVDGDGVPDLAVGAPATAGSGSPGSVTVFSGVDGSVLYTLHGAAAGDQFGAALDAVTDMDGDGIADLVIGAPGSDAGAPDGGAASVHSGGNGSPIGAVNGVLPGAALGGSVCGDKGGAIKAGGEEPDVVITSTHTDGNGEAQLRRGPGLHLALTIRPEPGERIAAARLLGDVDGDGRTDVLLGTPSTDGTPGGARVVSGADGSTLLTLAHAAAGPGLGQVVAALGDVDGDGVADLAVANPHADAGLVDSGRALVFSGADGELLEQLSGSHAGAEFGSAMACVGDVTGDALDDFAIGAPTDVVSGVRAGSVAVLSFTPWATVPDTGVAGAGGVVPRLSGQGAVVAEHTVVLSLRDARPESGVMLVLGSWLAVDAFLAQLVPAPEVVIGALSTDDEGALDYELLVPDDMPPGIEIYHQFLVDDGQALGGQSRSNTLRATAL